MHHDLKIHRTHFNSKTVGLKDWEIRRNDRDFRTDDTVTFHEVITLADPELTFSPTGCTYGPVQIIGPVVINAGGLHPAYCIFQHDQPQA